MPGSGSTKEALSESMKELMKKKSFSKISVGEICENCGINRKSFYYHFRDKYDLVNWIYYVDFLEHVQTSDSCTAGTLFASICQYFYSEADFYRNALQIQGQNSFHEYFHETLSVYLRAMFQDIFSDEEQQDFTINFFCDSFYSAIYRWLTQRHIMPVNEFLHHIQEIFKSYSRLFPELQR